ncbi:hypothetical protein F511_22635 [Dorcoceras hygrometricum]|uniref:Uncharacterized protein n=1 Tax=Dorcoceras hygrometricum TaxID=472368 RepID=A0A2Z7D6J4_9LAMI|nr:hypothetical protein F511_22635 [Dorcoceras hygrometricum]
MQGTPSWFTSLEQEHHEDQAQNNKKSIVKVQKDEVQNGSSAYQVQRTSAVFKCRCIDKRSDQVQLKSRKEQNKRISRADKKRALNESKEEKSSDQLNANTNRNGTKLVKPAQPTEQNSSEFKSRSWTNDNAPAHTWALNQLAHQLPSSVETCD